MPDHLVRIMTRDGSLRASAAVTTDLVEETRKRQQTDPTATVALGRLATGAALMSSLLKGDQRLALQIEANGPLQKLHAETDAEGHVRTSIKVPVAGLPPREGRFDVAGAVGKAGFLHVVKDLGLKEPYRGMVQLYSSEIGEDLAYYFTISEQTPSTVALGVELAEDASVLVAGGFLLQLMPDGDPGLVPLLEERLTKLPPTTSLLKEGLTPTGILERLLVGIDFDFGGEIPLSFRCTCSRRQIMQVLASLGTEELSKMKEENEGASVTCEFCREVYDVSPLELESFIKARSAG